jgi:hypothetical protein
MRATLRLHLLLRRHHVHAELELHAHQRAPLERGGGDLLDPLHGVERFLDGRETSRSITSGDAPG